MFELIKTRWIQGFQTIKEIRTAIVHDKFRGFPELNAKLCISCEKCEMVCPVKAIRSEILSLDMGKCLFCGDCERECSRGVIQFTNEYRLAADQREKLIIENNIKQKTWVKSAIKAKKEIKKLFGRSLKLRQVSSGGCNSCEMELNACSNVNFDMGRFGIDIVASPRHADGLLITGPLTENMEAALNDAYKGIPTPKIIILAGSCAISGGLFEDLPSIRRQFTQENPIDLYIPGCPVHPLTVINGLLDFLGRK